MSYIQDFFEKVKAASSVTPDQDVNPVSTLKVIELSKAINAWHDKRPIPERWYPVQLGRLATRFEVSRELAALALQYGGWFETRKGNYSLWTKGQDL